ncbi:MAG: glutamate--tRNA ligase, partial [Patescibacteria group bacterium]
KNIYKKYLQKMIDEGHAYLSNDENIEEGKRAEVIRFKNPNKKIKFNDLIRGEIEFDTTELKDFVIAKSLEEPVYHLAVVVDDFEMGVNHIIRGEDGISNTPRQILIQEAIAAPRPIYAHLPLVLAEDRSKLSKRKHGEIVSLSYYRQKGYLAEAMINFLALLGWNPGTDQEIFSMQELIGQFDLFRVQKSGAIFNIEKLNWINSQYIKKMGEDELLEKCIPFIKITNHKLQIRKLKKILKIKQERMNNLAEAGDEIAYFFEQPEYKKELLLWKEEKNLDKTKQHFEKISEIINEIEENNFTSHNIKEKVWEYAEEQGRGNALWPLRVALTGLDKSPEPFIVAEILGKKETLNRIKNAVKKI